MRTCHCLRASQSLESFDAALAKAAINAGALLPQTHASLGTEAADARSVRLRQSSSSREVAASLVLAADGVGGSLVCRLPGYQAHVPQHSWIGAGAVARDGTAPYCPGTIFMGCGSEATLPLRLEQAH